MMLLSGLRVCIFAAAAVALLNTRGKAVHSQKLYSNSELSGKQNPPRNPVRTQDATNAIYEVNGISSHPSEEFAKALNHVWNTSGHTQMDGKKRRAKEKADVQSGNPHRNDVRVSLTSDMHSEHRPVQGNVVREQASLEQNAKRHMQKHLLRSRSNMTASETVTWWLKHGDYPFLHGDSRMIDEKMRRSYNDSSKSSGKVGLPMYCNICKCVSYSYGLFTNCSRRHLQKPPIRIDKTTFSLILSFNRIEYIASGSFDGLDNMRLLDLQFNKLSIIEENTFEDMVNLEVLLLNSNDFVIASSFARPGVFDGLHSLRALMLHDNIVMYLLNHSSLDGRTFKYLHNLELLYIDGYLNITFDKHFLNTSIEDLKMSGTKGECGILFLKNNTFEGVPKLRNLTIDACGIVDIEPGTFSRMKNLWYLDLSRNYKLNFEIVNKAMKPLVAYNRVQYLDIRFIVPADDVGSKLTVENMANINALPLVELRLDENSIEVFNYNAILSQQQTLRLLTLRRNRLYLGLFVLTIIFNNPCLVTLDAKDQNKHPIFLSDGLYTWDSKYNSGIFSGNKQVETSNSHLRTRPLMKVHHNTPITMKDDNSKGKISTSWQQGLDYRLLNGTMMNASKDKISLETLIFTSVIGNAPCIDFDDSKNVLKYIDYSQNFMTRLDTTCFESLYVLTYLNLSHSHVETVRGNIFKDLRSLTVLDMSQNFFSYTLEYSNILKFSSLPKVEFINLSKNRISSLKSDIFKNNHNLRTLDLSDNYLTQFNEDFSNHRNLSHLNLSRNRLHQLGKNVIDSLTKIAEHHTVSVDLSFNTLSCSCQTIPFLKLVLESKIVFINGDNYTCIFNNGTTVRLMDHIPDALAHECITYFAVIITCTIVISCFLVFVISMIAYRYRWCLMYLYYMYKVRKSDEEERDGEFTWDAFPSFADNDAKFVGTDMRENLEEGHGIRLHIRHRDYPLAEVNAVNISNAVRMSRKTVLVLSRHFFRNKWCNFELNMARVEGIYTERQVIILIFVEDIPEAFLTQQVVELLRECRVLDLPKEGTVKDGFWQQLADYIRE